MLSRSLLTEFQTFLDSEWPDQFDFDKDRAIQTGTIVVCYTKTHAPIPLGLKINKAIFEEGRVTQRELRIKIKDCLPPQIVKQQISTANSLLRGANRKNLKSVEKAYKVWVEKTESALKRAFGEIQAQHFLTSHPLPAQLKQSSIQAIHFLVETKIDRLKSL